MKPKVHRLYDSTITHWIVSRLQGRWAVKDFHSIREPETPSFLILLVEIRKWLNEILILDGIINQETADTFS
ncbi:hypothetical protein PoB_000512200 [Plakobranchus ocellatus]|uniref:Uncharacterized protein n=1 Tax=Plakobranchus ocellatus TaxID=259542 RepID=A0AAV3Y751_9GAST|nr:hypothetical protein PoB_000512200 [Plakobranchus ocellatus]